MRHRCITQTGVHFSARRKITFHDLSILDLRSKEAQSGSEGAHPKKALVMASIKSGGDLPHFFA
jgi:hypothetical protein